MMQVLGDLHIHTALSPCADNEMSPVNIINMAKLLNKKILGITDHNSTENVISVIKAAKNHGILVIPGVEVNTREEVHVLCFFRNLDSLKEFQKVLDKNLPSVENRPGSFGHQYIMDENGNITGEKRKLLINAVDLTLTQTVEIVKRLKGICIPSHIDRPHYSLLNTLGFIPEDVDFAALEVSRNVEVSDFIEKHKQIKNYDIIQSTDAHRLKEMVGVDTQFIIEKLTVEETFKAIQRKGGRSVVVPFS